MIDILETEIGLGHRIGQKQASIDPGHGTDIGHDLRTNIGRVSTGQGQGQKNVGNIRNVPIAEIDETVLELKK